MLVSIAIQAYSDTADGGTASAETVWPDVSAHASNPFAITENEPTAWLDAQENSVVPLEIIDTALEVPEEDDVWSISTETISRPRQGFAKSWEQHADPVFRKSSSLLSEAGSSVFEAVVCCKLAPQATSRALKPHVVLRSLLQLGLGRDSSLFTFKSNGSYSSRVPEPRMYGLTHNSTRSTVARFGECGELFRSIKAKVTRVYDRYKCPAASITVARLVSSVLLELDARVVARQPMQSLLQLQAAFKEPFLTLNLMSEILDRIWSLRSDAEVLSYVYLKAQEVERTEPCLKPLMAKLVGRVTKPWLRAISVCIGLAPAESGHQVLRDWLLRKTSDDEEVDGEEEDSGFPEWLSKVDQAYILETFEGMRLLDMERRSEPSRAKSFNRALEWSFSWEELLEQEQSEARAAIVPDNRMVAASIAAEENSPSLFTCFQDADAFESTYTTIENLPVDDASGRDLAWAIDQIDVEHERADLVNMPSLEVCATNSFRPLLAARARVVNRACLNELFQTGIDAKAGRPLSLSYHLALLNKYLLMGDGMFVTRLSHALFDPDLASAERVKGKVRTGKMGLRLGSRSTWPPASSELQLALMGILTASFENDPYAVSPASHELPGDLSFALRSLSENEIQQCLDQESLEALDFLRVQYKAPPPLNAVITQSILGKYDSIQRLLIRMTRLVFIVNQSSRQRLRHAEGVESRSRTVLKFIQAAHHFVTAFADYLLNTAIGANWTAFSTSIAELESSLQAGSRVNDATLRSVANIRSLHERTLDDILFASLLRKRHEQVRGLFDDILRLILRFAAMDTSATAEVEALYAKFTKQVGVFVNVCKGLVERKEYAGKEENGLQALLTRLTMNDFYSSEVEKVLRL